jgi:hypothetical protein
VKFMDRIHVKHYSLFACYVKSLAFNIAPATSRQTYVVYFMLRKEMIDLLLRKKISYVYSVILYLKKLLSTKLHLDLFRRSATTQHYRNIISVVFPRCR